MIYEFQSQLIFPTHAVPRAGPLPRGAERLSVKTPDGETLAGVRLTTQHPTTATGTLILSFAGNAWNSQEAASYLHEIYPEAEVIAFHYRGYAPSTGSPSAEALIADAPLVYDHAVKLARPKRTVVVGLSIGSGVAAQLARSRSPDGLILVTPFDSLRAVAQSLYPWVPMGALFRHQIDAAGALGDSDLPVAIIAAERDDIIPQARTDALRKSIRRLVFDRTIRNAGHNDLYARSDFQAAMREALKVVSR